MKHKKLTKNKKFVGGENFVFDKKEKGSYFEMHFD